MRLVDADALDDVVQDLNENKNYGITRGEYKLIDSVLFEFPTVEERKKGEWIPAFDGKFTGGAYWFSCSKCKRIVPEVRNGGWNFCPNCGADMRGGKGERNEN